MSGFADDSLPEGWDALSRADAEALGPPDGAKERVRLHLAATLGLAAGFGAAGAIVGAASAGAAASPVPAEGFLGAVAKALLLKKAVVLGVVAATAVTGGTVAYVEVRERKVSAEQALAHKQRVAPAAPVAPVLPAPVAETAPVVVAEALPEKAPDTLGEERTLLDGARAAIAHGRLGEAQTLLVRHAQAFPAGRLVEEREALTIRLLVRQGHRAEATRRAARFRQEHPHSIQQPNIDAALRR